MPLGAFISTGRELGQAVDRVRLADELGYDAAYVTHINGRDSLTVCTAYALATERIAVGPGVIPIYTQTPASMAQTAATIADLSGGRFRLGLGVSHRPIVAGWHGTEIGKPVRETREYVAILRAIFAGQTPPDGERWQTGFALTPNLVRPDLPIYLAGLSPKMLETAGEIADGVILWLCNPRYVESVVVPAVRAGRERAGKPLEGFDIVAAVPSSCTEDPATAYAAMRRDLLPYLGLPFYRAMIERSGFAEDLERYDAAAAKGDVEGMTAAPSDAFLELLCAIGDRDAVRAGIARYQAAGATSPCVGPIARSDVEATLQAARP